MLRSLLTPPHYDTPEDQRTASLLWWYLLFGIFANVIPYVAFSAVSQNFSRPIFLISPVLLIILLVLLRRKQLNIVRWGFIGFFWIYMLIQVTATGGIYSSIYFWFIFYLVFGGSVFGLKTFYWLVGTFIFQTYVFVALAYLEIMPSPLEVPRPAIGYALNYTFFAMFMASIIWATRRAMQNTINQLHHSERIYHNVIRDQTEYISRFKPDGTRIFINDAYCVSRESPHEAVMKENVFVAAEERGMILKGVLSSLDHRNPIGRHTIKRYKTDGTAVWEEWVNRAIFGEHGEVLEYQAVGRDITAQKMLEERDQQLQLAREREAFTKEFVANMSHDLKAPLSVIHTSLHLMSVAQDMDSVQRRARILQQQTDRLETMINDIVAMSALEYVPHLEKERISLNLFFHDMIKPLRLKAESKKIKLKLHLPWNEIRLDLSVEQMQRAIVNLIDNAINYTPQDGTIIVAANHAEQNVCIMVQDTGIGIPPDDLPYIFERAFRASNADTAHTGTGIGLSIVKKVVELHEGTITVESTLDVGTTFKILLPLPTPDTDNDEH